MMNKQPNEDRELSLQKTCEVTLRDHKAMNSSIGEQKAMTARKRRVQEMTEEERRDERRTANRRSAFESRQRRKVLIEELQETVQRLSKENALVRKEADNLRLEVDRLLLENRQLRLQPLAGPMPLSGLHNATSPNRPGLWGMQHGININMGVPVISALDQYLSSGNAGNIAQPRSNCLETIPTHVVLTEQARDYLQNLHDRQDCRR